MIEQQKDIPDDVVRIQQVWIKAINRVAESIAYCSKIDTMDEKEGRSGTATVIESVLALSCLLVDYGEARVRSDIMQWRKEHTEDFKASNRETMYRHWFEYMLDRLNYYGLLFDTVPKGYSNTEMKSI